jgi:predicted Fe-S protein YdhL (DUF1289 family)
MTAPAYARAARRIRQLATLALEPGGNVCTLPASPCNNVCRMGRAHSAESDWCLGCLRTLDEIAAWAMLDTAQQRTIWRDLLHRANRIESIG